MENGRCFFLLHRNGGGIRPFEREESPEINPNEGISLHKK